MKRAIIALGFFVFGFLIAPYTPVFADTQTNQFLPRQHIPFEAIKVYPEEVRIIYPGLQYAKVTSNSMAPLITASSTIVEKVPKTPYEIRAGDIISFYEPEENSVIIHVVTRVVNEKGKTAYRTKGFANQNEDEWLVPCENVKGILVAVLR